MGELLTSALFEEVKKNMSELRSSADNEKELNHILDLLSDKESLEKIRSLNTINDRNVKLNTVINKEETNDFSDVDVVIIFALKIERTKAFEALNVSLDEQRTTYYDLQKKYGFTFQKFKIQDVQVAAVTQTSMGMAMASSLTTRAILAFNPKLVVMTGICAGRKGKINIGDILIADQVYDYTAGKVTKDGKVVRPRTISCDDKIKQIIISPEIDEQNINQLIRSRWITTSIPVSQTVIHIKAMGTGTSVIDDKTTFEAAIKNQDDLYGIDMEAYGVALASDVLHIPWLVIKGVQDYGDGEKNITESNIREYAAFVSAVLLEKIIPYFFI